MTDPGIGLCADCQHGRIVPGGRSTFYLCRRSLTDPAYPKYPPLPVIACRGYELRPPANGDDKLSE
jgi:hypothetical protein